LKGDLLCWACPKISRGQPGTDHQGSRPLLERSVCAELKARTNLYHPQIFQRGQKVDSPDFGKITATLNNPRLIQFRSS